MLTTQGIATRAQACEAVAWYCMRWTIEQVFRSLEWHSSRIEYSHFEDAGGVIKLAMIALIAAVRAMQGTGAVFRCVPGNP